MAPHSDPAAFWAWWAEARGEIARLLADRRPAAELAQRIRPRVLALDPELGWELRPGRQAEWALCVVAEGDPRRRALTERWLRGAPPADATFEYHPSRPAAPPAAGTLLAVPGHPPLRLDDVRIASAVDEDRREIDVRVFHPAFAGLREEVRATATFLILDRWLGEDAVELWIGAIATSTAPLADGVPAAVLPDLVEALRARHPEPGWMLLEGPDEDGRTAFASVRVPCKWIEAPACDLHASVAFPYAADEMGLPDDDQLAALYATEDELLADLGTDGVVLAAHQTGGGRRLYHLYLDPDGPAPRRLDAWSERAEVTVSPDPGWTAVQGFRP